MARTELPDYVMAAYTDFMQRVQPLYTNIAQCLVHNNVLPHETSQKAPTNVLCVGCGDGPLEHTLLEQNLLSSSNTTFHLVEPVKPFLDKALQKLESHNATVLHHQTPFEDITDETFGTKFDLILMAHVLYFFADKPSVLSRLVKLLSPRGCLVLVHLSSNDPAGYLTVQNALGNPGHPRYEYTDQHAKEDLETVAKETGHKVTMTKIDHPVDVKSINQEFVNFMLSKKDSSQAEIDTVTQYFAKYQPVWNSLNTVFICSPP